MSVIYNEITKEYLLELINHKRETMIQTAAIFGMSSENTLLCSQELDQLIVKYQRMTK